MPEIEVSIYDGTSPATFIATLDSDDPDDDSGASERQWLDQYNDPGSFSFRIHADDPILQANPGLLTYGNIARFRLNGTDRFAGIIETREIPPAPPGEEVERVWTVAGRGLLALLEDAIVYPEGTVVGSYQRQRRFDFTAIAYDDSAWIAATEIQRQDSTSGDEFRYYGQPEGWPDGTAFWIWSRALTITSDPATSTDPGTSYFRKTFTLATGSPVAVFATGDNEFKLFLDGEPLIEGTDWQTLYREDRILAAGEHQLAVVGTNIMLPSGYSGPGSILVTVIEKDENDQLTTTIVEHTDSSWVCLDYPLSVPGMSIGMILRILIEEAQARGALEGITLGFTDTQDFHSNAWAEEDPDIAFDVGSTLLDVIDTLIEQYVDAYMTPLLELDVFNKGTRGADLTEIVLEVGEHFESEETSGGGHLTNAILARDTTSRLTTSESPASLAVKKRIETYLELALAPSEARAQAMSVQVLIEFAYPTVEVRARVTPESGVYEEWGPGDTIMMPDPTGIPVPSNVISIAVEEDTAGHPVYHVEATQDEIDDASS